MKAANTRKKFLTPDEVNADPLTMLFKSLDIIGNYKYAVIITTGPTFKVVSAKSKSNINNISSNAYTFSSRVIFT